MITIDAHAHIYMKTVARKAVDNIGRFYNLPMLHPDGTVERLVRRLEAGGIDGAVVQSAAMSPKQVRGINSFISETVAVHPNLIGFGTLHPDMEDIDGEIEFILSNHLQGIKIHNDMLKISMLDERMDRIFSACEGTLPVLLHMGDNRFAYDNPDMIPTVLKRHHNLKLICAHMGGFREWKEAERFLADTNAYVDTSSSFFELGTDGMKRMIEVYGEDRVLYGSDYPMGDPCIERDLLLHTELSNQTLEKILGGNICRLLKK